MSVSASGGPAAGGMSTAMMALVAAIVVVALVGIAATVVVVETSGGPTATVKDFLKSNTSNRPGSAFNDTVWSLNQSTYPFWFHLSEFVPANNISLDIHDLTEVTQAQMTVHEREFMNETAHGIEMVFNVTVQDYCFVKYNITMTTTGDGEKEIHNYTGEFSLVKVNGSWLIVTEFDIEQGHLAHEPAIQPAFQITG